MFLRKLIVTRFTLYWIRCVKKNIQNINFDFTRNVDELLSLGVYTRIHNSFQILLIESKYPLNLHFINQHTRVWTSRIIRWRSKFSTHSVIINTIALLEPRLSIPGYSGDSHTLYNVLSQNKPTHGFRCFESTQIFPCRDLIKMF